MPKARATAPAEPSHPCPPATKLALAELEQLVSRIDAGQMPLDQLLAGYQRGAQLLAFAVRLLRGKPDQGAGRTATQAVGGKSDARFLHRRPFDFNGWSTPAGARGKALSSWVVADAPADLGEAMRYAVLDGGKRLRPLLVLAPGEAVRRQRSGAGSRAARGLRGGADPRLFAGARRHALHGQRRAAPWQAHRACAVWRGAGLLAGDALQALAFELLVPEDGRHASGHAGHAVPPAGAAAGSAGMAGGQAIDLASVGRALTEDAAAHMHRLKTGALLQGSVMMGAACGRRGQAVACRAGTYGAAMGLAFQVVDDILDVTADSATLGKTAGKDAAQDKPTYVSLLGWRARGLCAPRLLRRPCALDASGLPTRAPAALAAGRTTDGDRQPPSATHEVNDDHT
jgi:farnesyl diphosphate synthase